MHEAPAVRTNPARLPPAGPRPPPASGSPGPAEDRVSTHFLFNFAFPGGTGDTRKGLVGHMARFALALDAYARLSVDGWLFDFADPTARRW